MMHFVERLGVLLKRNCSSIRQLQVGVFPEARITDTFNLVIFYLHSGFIHKWSGAAHNATKMKMIEY